METMTELVIISEIVSKIDALERMYTQESDFLDDIKEELKLKNALDENIVRCQRIRHILTDMKPRVVDATKGENKNG